MHARDRLRAKTRREGRCLLFTGSTNKDGYGWFAAVGERYAHRAAYALFNGPIPEGMCVLHKCDTPACVNPRHLELGTNRVNHEQKATRGRAKGINRGNKNGMRKHPERRPTGDRNGMRTRPECVKRGSSRKGSKLNEDVVRTIRQRAAEGVAQRALAAEFNVCQPVICCVVNRKTWRHVT